MPIVSEIKDVAAFVKWASMVRFVSIGLFRGHSNANWALSPSIARGYDDKPDHLASMERRCLELFKQRAHLKIQFQPRNDWDWLMIGQHYGMPTRLLDWTANPLVALYFACHELPSIDGEVLCLIGARNVDLVTEGDPFSVSQIGIIDPPFIDDRIASQRSKFTVFAEPLVPLERGRVHRILIPARHKEGLRGELRNYGVTTFSLFPDLGGLARDIISEFQQMKTANKYVQELLARGTSQQ